ncbi:hypothetical protein BT93_L1975 [Corymbia citriodora subsp. variegata]|uniref:Uncharacterized protein n=1 Tax=Corymbia citriodora subsp. variegata TaxID=360336 RepID=A0A8T0CQC1_CORYI|nr:hypothetical protein BT93_L1975 [Corymbia citriodora subsp. variegata]
MASSTTMAFLALLVVLLPMAATAADSLAPFIEELCNEVQCGKGSCVVNTSAPFGFECQCDAGWKRTRLDDEDNLKFLPCVIPNCSVEYSCMPAPPPVPSVPYNTSVYDPCYWIYCGGGTCTKSATYEHTCQCDAGYTNLLNVSVFPCFSDCAIGNDCEKLGIKVSNSSTTGSDNRSYAHMFLPGKLLWMTIFTASMALVLWN